LRFHSLIHRSIDLYYLKFLAIATIAISCILISYVLAFTYLKLNNKPVKSDIVVLFIGPEYEKRLKEAHQLLKENYAKAFIIPAYHSEYTLINGKINRTRTFHRNILKNGIQFTVTGTLANPKISI